MARARQGLRRALEDACGQAIELAQASLDRTAGEFDPAVGAVLLDADGNVLASASRHEDGRRHAEVCAINKLAALELKEVRYVVTTLEPCSYRGRDRDEICCAKMIVRLGASECLIGTLDPAAGVRGRGAHILQIGHVYFSMFPRNLHEKVLEINRSYLKLNSELYQRSTLASLRGGIVPDEREFDLDHAPPAICELLVRKSFQKRVEQIYQSLTREGYRTISEDKFTEWFSYALTQSPKHAIRKLLYRSATAGVTLYELLARYSAVRPEWVIGREEESRLVYQELGRWYYSHRSRKRRLT